MTSPAERHDTAVVNHVGLCTVDLDAAQRFYTELLGFEVERTMDIPDEAAGPLLGVDPPVGLRVVYLRRGAFTLELLRFDRPGNPDWTERRFNEPGLTHISYSVDDLPDVVRRVEALGGTIVHEIPMAAFVRDPDGQLLELLPMEYRIQLDAMQAARVDD
jgi:catechol 2,3-dioxygenase-like lactoylglutathione lyase family enzyme